MAKPKSKTNNYNHGGWAMSKKSFDEFKKVTEANKREVIVVGRILYAIDTINLERPYYLNFIEYTPIMKKGRVFVSGHKFFPNHDYWIFSDESHEDFKHRYKPLAELMKKGYLFYNPSDALVKYVRK